MQMFDSKITEGTEDLRSISVSINIDRFGTNAIQETTTTNGLLIFKEGGSHA